MFTIFLRTIKDKKLSLLIYCISALCFLWMYVSLFPSIASQFDALNEYIKSFPKGFMDAFGIDPETFTTFEGYIGSEQFSFVWPIMLIALVGAFGANAIATEIEKGSAELLLSLPISRIKIFISRLLAGVLVVTIFSAISILSVAPIADLYDIGYKFSHFWSLFLLACTFGYAVLGISLLFSAIFNEKGKAIFATTGLLIAMYVLFIVSALKENLSDLKYISFFYYFSPSKVLAHNVVPENAFLIFILIFFISSAAAGYWFNKKDVAV